MPIGRRCYVVLPGVFNNIDVLPGVFNNIRDERQPTITVIDLASSR